MTDSDKRGQSCYRTELVREEGSGDFSCKINKLRGQRVMFEGGWGGDGVS